MSDLNLKPYDPLYPMRVHPYEELLKDQNASVIDKINNIIDYLNSVGKLTSDVVKNWNTVYNWVMNDGLTTGINNKLEDMLAKGEFNPIFNDIITKIGDITTLTTTDKTNLTKAINELVTKIGNLANLTTTDKTSLVNAINENTSKLAEIVTSAKKLGAKFDGVTDDTIAINNTIASLTNGGIILFPYGSTVKITGSIVSNPSVQLLGFNTIIDASSVPAGTPSLILNATSIAGTSQKIALKGIVFKGHSNPSDNVYTVNSVCLEFNTSSFVIENCEFRGYDKVQNFKSGSYLIDFIDCVSFYNNYGYYSDATGKTNLGAGIHWTRGMIAHSNYGMYNNMNEITFFGTAFDQSLQSHIADNITSDGGYHIGQSLFDNCRFEACNGVTAIKNSGYMRLRDCMFYDPNPTNIIDNSGVIDIEGGLWRPSDTSYRATGTGTIRISKMKPVSFSNGVRLSAKESKIRNSDFEAGNMNGWNQTVGTQSNVQGTTKNSGSYALAVTNTNNVGCTIVSDKILSESGAKNVHLGFYEKNTNPTTVYIHFTAYNREGAQLTDQYVALSPNETSFSYRIIAYAIPTGTDYFTINVSIGNPETGICYLDDFYLTQY